MARRCLRKTARAATERGQERPRRSRSSPAPGFRPGQVAFMVRHPQAVDAASAMPISPRQSRPRRHRRLRRLAERVARPIEQERPYGLACKGRLLSLAGQASRIDRLHELRIVAFGLIRVRVREGQHRAIEAIGAAQVPGDRRGDRPRLRARGLRPSRTRRRNRSRCAPPEHRRRRRSLHVAQLPDVIVLASRSSRVQPRKCRWRPA